jgi:hypothetical protein
LLRRADTSRYWRILEWILLKLLRGNIVNVTGWTSVFLINKLAMESQTFKKSSYKPTSPSLSSPKTLAANPG